MGFLCVPLVVLVQQFQNSGCRTSAWQTSTGFSKIIDIKIIIQDFQHAQILTTQRVVLFGLWCSEKMDRDILRRKSLWARSVSRYIDSGQSATAKSPPSYNPLLIFSTFGSVHIIQKWSLADVSWQNLCRYRLSREVRMISTLAIE